MSYQEFPDARPLSVKMTLGRMPRLAAVTVMGGSAFVAMACLVGLIANLDYYAVWLGLAAIAGLVAILYAAAIRWADFHKTWPRSRHRHRHRVPR